MPNPFRPRDRETFSFPVGSTVADVALMAGVEEYVAVVDGEQVDPTLVLTETQVLLYRVPEGITLVGVGKFVLQLITAVVIQAAFALLFPPPKPQQRRDDEGSPTYAFSGISNNRTEGQPIPIGYGELKLGGQIVNEYVESGGLFGDDIYRALICFGEGPFTSVGGITEDTPRATPIEGADIPTEIQINGNPAANFQGVRVWARLGSNQQDAIPGFDEVRTVTPVNAEMPAELGSASQATGFDVTGWDSSSNAFTTTVNDPIWDEYGYSFDISDEEVDAAIIRIEFPQGFFRLDQTGEVEQAFFGYQIRYIELDGAGTPIASGGPLLDGYIREVPRLFTFSRRAPFSIAERVDFTDIQTNAGLEIGKALEIDGTAGTQVDCAPTAFVPYLQGETATDFSLVLWHKLETIPAGTHTLLTTLQTGGSNSGFQIAINESRLVTTWGRGATVRNLIAPASSSGDLSAPMTAWQHVVVTFGGGVARLYINGALVVADAAPSADEVIWSDLDLQIGDEDIVGLIDHVQVYDTVLSPESIEYLYNNGLGRRRGTSTASPQQPVFSMDFDDTLPASQEAFQGWWGTGVGSGGASSGVEEGIIPLFATGATATKRSRYRVEIIRWRRKSTSARVNNDAEIREIQTVISEQFTFPGSPLLGVEVRATDQLQGGVPTITAVCKQRPAKVWDGASTTSPNIVDAYSTNPAWIALAHVLTPEIGLGAFYRVRDIAEFLPSFLDWANYCDEVVYDGTRRIIVDNTNLAGAAEFDVTFDNTTTDPSTGEDRAQITFLVPLADIETLPPTWETGRFIRLSGFPTDSDPNVDVDPNSPDDEGYEIISVSLELGLWTVVCWWDRDDEGDPWSGSSLVAALGGDPTDIDGGTFEGASRRFEFNGTFDSPGKGWTGLLDICAVGRATPVPVGSGLKIRYSAPRDPVGVLQPGNIIAGSFKVDYASPRTRANVITLSILDREQGFDPVPITSQDPALQSVANQTFIVQENKRLFGVTDAGQAERQGNHILAVNRLQKRSGEFRSGVDSFPYEPGDLLIATSDVLPRGAGARIAGHSASNNLGMTSDREDFSGGAWTASGVTVSTNTETDPIRGTLTADTIDGNGYVAQTLAPSMHREGWHTASILFKDNSGAVPVLELATDRVTSAVTFDLAGLTVAPGDSFEMPTKGGIQDVGGGWRWCWATWYVRPSDGAKRPTALELRVRPIRSGFSAAVYAAQVCVTQREFPAMAPGLRNLVLADAFTVPSGSPTITYTDIRRSTNTLSIDTTLTPPGDYPAGSTVFTTAELPLQAIRSNPVIISDDNPLLIELKNIRRSSDLSALCEWVEYNEDVFDDGIVEDDSFRTNQDHGSGPNSGVGIDKIRIPSAPVSVSLSTYSIEDPSGAHTGTLTVGWDHDPATRHYVTGTEVFMRTVADGSIADWVLAGRVEGRVSRLDITVLPKQIGKTVEVSVAPLSRVQPRGRPASGFHSRIVVDPLAWNPEAPTGLSLDVAGCEGTYVAEYDAAVEDDGRRASKRIEIRRGGWILGQTVAVIEEGELRSAPTCDVFVPAGDESVGRLYARAQSRAGAYSEAVELDVTPSLPFAAELPEIGYGPDMEWETSTGGTWASGSPSIDGPTVGSNLQVNADGELEFASGVTGTYTTARDAFEATSVAQSRAPRLLYIGAACEAVHVHPTAIGDWTWGLGSLEGQRWSLEGPTNPTAIDGPNASLVIEFRLNTDGTSSGWGGWRKFRCGIYSCVDVQFRLVATRPSTDYQVRIKRFHTTVRIPQGPITQHTTRDLSARAEIL